MPWCAARGCKNASGSVKMNHFPKNPDIRKRWIQNSGIQPSEHSELCEVIYYLIE